MGALGGYGIGGGMGAAMQSGLIEGAGAAGAGGIPLGPDVSSNLAIPAPAASAITSPSPAPINALFDATNETGITNASFNPDFTAVSTPTAPAAQSPQELMAQYVQQDATEGRMKPPSFMQALGQQFPTTGSKVAAGLGALGAVGAFDQPKFDFAAPQQQPSNYRKQGPVQREYDPNAYNTPARLFFPDQGILRPNFLAAKGGEVPSVPELEDGGFVLTKKAVDGIGKGDNERGQRAAAAGLGAIPIKGPGTGTSDSIPTTIDGKRPALLSNGEAYVPRDQVKRRGGAKKFYALMKQAEKSARRA